MLERVMGVTPKALLAAAVVLMASCASQPNVANSVVTPEGTVQVMDDIYHLTRAIPDWVFLGPEEIEYTSEYQDRYVFMGESTGSDLVGLQLWVKNFVESADLAKFVGGRVRDAFESAAAGDSGMLETFREDVVKAVSEARYAGARIVMRYWWQIRTARADGGIEDIYEYYVLFTVDRDQVDASITRALEENDVNVTAKTEEEQAARDRVKSVMRSEGL